MNGDKHVKSRQAAYLRPVIMTVGIGFFIFWYGLLSLPEKSLTYVFPMMILSAASVIAIDDYTKKRLIFFWTYMPFRLIELHPRV